MREADDKLAWIQALRAVAVLMVVLTHARYLLLDTDQFPLAQQMFFPAAMGVDLFFIISGFIMVYTTAGQHGVRAAATFGVKRFARIWPAYAVVTVLAALLLRGGLGYFLDPGQRGPFIKSLLFIPVDPNGPPFFNFAFPLGWTLAFEMYFYIVFGLCMLAGRLRWFMLGAWMFASLVLIPMGRGGPTLDVRQHIETHSAYLQLVTNPIVYEFLAGVAIGHLYRSSWFRIRGTETAWLLVVCGIGFAAWYAFGGIGIFHGPAQWGWPLALMVALLALASKTVVLQVPVPLVWVGTVSYSMYLTHYLGQHVLVRLLERWQINTHTWAQVFLTALCALPLAALAHWLLERKLSGAVRRVLMAVLNRVLPPPATPVAPLSETPRRSATS